MAEKLVRIDLNSYFVTIDSKYYKLAKKIRIRSFYLQLFLTSGNEAFD